MGKKEKNQNQGNLIIGDNFTRFKLYTKSVCSKQPGLFVNIQTTLLLLQDGSKGPKHPLVWSLQKERNFRGSAGTSDYGREVICFCFELHPVILSDYYWLYTQELILAVLGETIAVLGACEKQAPYSKFYLSSFPREVLFCLSASWGPLPGCPQARDVLTT